MRGTVHLQFSSQFMSPLPPSDELRVYEEYAPGAAKRMLDLQDRFQDQAEQEQDHRHVIELADSRRRDRGQVFSIVFKIAAHRGTTRDAEKVLRARPTIRPR
jgi:uncharacterized membrane protein